MKCRTVSMLPALAALLAAATVSWAQAPQAQGSASTSTQATGESNVTPGNAGANVDGSAQGSAQGSAAAAGHSGQAGTALAGGSSVNAVLTKPVDSRRSKPGDPVSARTSQPAMTEDGAIIPKGSLLTGHLSQVHGQGAREAGSSMALVFDKAVPKDGHEIPLRNVAIRAVAAADSSAGAGSGDGGATMSPAGGIGAGARTGGSVVGGGLVGRTAGTLGGAVGGVAGGAGALASGGTGVLQAGPGATGGLDAAGMLTAQSTGVFGLRGVSLPSGAFDAATGSVVASSAKSVHLDQGTRLLLGPAAGTPDHSVSGPGFRRGFGCGLCSCGPKRDQADAELVEVAGLQGN